MLTFSPTQELWKTFSKMLRSRLNRYCFFDSLFFFSSLNSNNQACSSAVRKPAISLADSTELR